ncbi:MAG TPA: hypothetical protein VFO52_10460 [Longimicrobiales bacterium]|nr:hypothetical protein [Longimicrobiales bacterium]
MPQLSQQELRGQHAPYSDVATATHDPALVSHQPVPGVWSSMVAALKGGDQFGLFVLVGLGMIALAPRHLLLAHSLITQLLTGQPARHDLTAWPYVPITLPLGVIVALITFRMERRARIIGLATALLLAFTWIYRPVDPDFLLFLALFFSVAFALIHLPLPRLAVALLVTVYVVVALVAVLRWWKGTAAVGFIGGLPVLVPMLWYSVYEHGKQKALGLRRFLTYVSGRLFGTPVVTYDDLFTPARGAELTATRWAGVRTLYIALTASIVARIAAEVSAAGVRDSAAGFPLLTLSYIDYVRHSCVIVVRFNTFIGVLRLFGIPLRTNFRYWVLARTPNEHWQRWNVLAREWFLTFVFYPLMRARKGLFAAVMTALLAAGVLHTVPIALIRGFNASQVVAHSIYWVINGLAIYLVIKIPLMYPALPQKLGMRNSRAWSIAGIILTSAFYALLHGLRTEATTWAEMGHYVERLLEGLSV